MNRTDLNIGDTVVCDFKRVDGTLYEREMFVRELHNKNVAGLSYQQNSATVIGILYEVIKSKTPHAIK